MTRKGRGGALHFRADLPHEVRRVDHAWIPLSDGTRLAARIWLPSDAEEAPVPALLEAIPYRKNDLKASGDAGRHGWFAGHGYASVRVDIRGSGDSDGVLLDEYLPREQEDACEAIAWLAEQPWCSGAVGMWGVSWGGFAALQVAARRPPALRAIVSTNASDDRYADDVHYIGGCPLAYYLLSWATTMHVYATLPPDPAVVGDAWRDGWLRRLHEAEPYIAAWLGHQRRDAYWRQGSVCEDYAAVTCPVYAVSGWADGYRNAVLRLLEHLPGPRKGLIGPWSHHYPHDDVPPGPAIGFLQECLRWWDHWLKDVDTGIMDEPMLRLFLQDPAPPRPSYPLRSGRWICEPSWPSPNVRVERLALGGDGALGSGAPGPLAVRAPESTGVDAGDWDPFGNPADLPPDQRAEDGRSLCFTTAPLDEPLAIVGRPVLEVQLASDRPLAVLAVRLCDVAPDGASLLLTRGLLNLAHRAGHDAPQPLEPGRRETVRVELTAIAQVVPAGHRLRVALSQAYWPWAWPSPEPVTLTVHCGGASALELPLRERVDAEPPPAPFAEPEEAPRDPVVTRRLVPGDHTLERSVGARSTVLVHRYPEFDMLLPRSGLEVVWVEPDTFTIEDDDPRSARVDCRRSVSIARGSWRTRVEARSAMSADLTTFHVTSTLEAFEGAACVFAGAWSYDIPRDHA